jgi:DNA-binding response OmpR family regulator
LEQDNRPASAHAGNGDFLGRAVIVGATPDLADVLIGLVSTSWTVALCSNRKEAQERLNAFPHGLAIVEVPSAVSWQFELLAAGVGRCSVMALVPDGSNDLFASVLRIGADDCAFVPTSASVLAARLAAVHRRSGRTVSGGDDWLVIDELAHSVSVHGSELRLTPIEFSLLAYLARHPRQVLTRDQLLSAVWASDAKWQSRATVTEHVRRLRLRLGAAACTITTVYGIGYRFDPPRTTTADFPMPA